MRRWYVPSTGGDFRLDATGDTCVLTVNDPTSVELNRLGAFLNKARGSGWIDNVEGISPRGESRLAIKAPVVKAGVILAKGASGVRAGVLTAVRSTAGEIIAVYERAEDAIKAAEVATVTPKAEPKPAAATPKPTPKPDAAVTVRRPTPCCPNAIPGRDVRALDVLRDFCTPVQWADFTSHGVLFCKGSHTGHTYRLAHRYHPDAIRDTRICRDVDTGVVLHFHDWLVPAAEEVLAAMLFLTYREPWLRNEATYLGFGPGTFGKMPSATFANPSSLGGADGIADADFTWRVGEMAIGVLTPLHKRLKKPEVPHG